MNPLTAYLLFVDRTMAPVLDGVASLPPFQQVRDTSFPEFSSVPAMDVVTATSAFEAQWYAAAKARAAA